MNTELASQGVSVPAAMVAPVSSSSTVTTGGVDMQKSRRAMFVVGIGVFGASATVDGKLQGSADNSTGWTDIAGSNLTQLLAAGGNGKVAIMEIGAESVPVAFRYVRASVTVGTAASLVTVIPLGIDAAQKPGSQNNDASVVQKVVV